MTLTRDGGSLFSANMAGTLRLIVYLALASILMVLDHRGHWLGKVRYGAAIVIEPIYHLAGLPASGFRAARVAFADRKKLTEENKQLRVDLLLANARLNHMAAVSRQNQRLKKLLDTRRQLGMNVQLARVIDIDLGAFSHRLMLNVGCPPGRQGRPGGDRRARHHGAGDPGAARHLHGDADHRSGPCDPGDRHAHRHAYRGLRLACQSGQLDAADHPGVGRREGGRPAGQLRTGRPLPARASRWPP